MNGQAATNPRSQWSVWRPRILNVGRIVLGLAILTFVIVTTVRQWSSVRETFQRVSWLTFGASLALATASVGSNVLAWRSAVKALGVTVRVRDAAPIVLIGGLGKYVPGSVWAYVVQADLAKRAGVARVIAFLSSIVAMVVGVVVALAVAAFGVPISLAGARSAPSASNAQLGHLASWLVVIVLPIGVACLHPAVLNRLVAFITRLMRQSALLTVRLTWRSLLGIGGWSLAGLVLYGAHLWLLVRVGGNASASGLAGSVWAAAFAMGLGVLVFVAPSGIGVREFLLLTALAGLGVAWPVAWSLALCSRLVMTLADVVGASLSGFALRRTD